MTHFTIEQLNANNLSSSFNVGKYLRSASIESELADVLMKNNVSEDVIAQCCEVVVDHFAVAMFLEETTGN